MEAEQPADKGKDKTTIIKSQEGFLSALRIGDIALQSSIYEIDTLLSWGVWLLEQQSVKQYLNSLEIQKKTNGATYYD